MPKLRQLRPLSTDDVRAIRASKPADERHLCTVYDRSRMVIHNIRKRVQYKYVPDDASHPDEPFARLRMFAYPNYPKGSKPTKEMWRVAYAIRNQRLTQQKE